MTEGPRANRPPHWAFALAFRKSGEFVVFKETTMLRIGRRGLAAAAGTLASALLTRKPHAADTLGDLSRIRLSGGTEPPPFQWRLPDGTVKSLADYAGQGVVLNLWATWCVPCVAEMPALDALAAQVAPGIAVLPLSSDRGGAPTVDRFYLARGVRNLPIILDQGGAAARALGVRGIPTTLLIDAKGRERGRLEGTADWSTKEAIALIRTLAEKG